MLRVSGGGWCISGDAVCVGAVRRLLTESVSQCEPLGTSGGVGGCLLLGASLCAVVDGGACFLVVGGVCLVGVWSVGVLWGRFVSSLLFPFLLRWVPER